METFSYLIVKNPEIVGDIEYAEAYLFPPSLPPPPKRRGVIYFLNRELGVSYDMEDKGKGFNILTKTQVDDDKKNDVSGPIYLVKVTKEFGECVSECYNGSRRAHELVCKIMNERDNYFDTEEVEVDYMI